MTDYNYLNKGNTDGTVLGQISTSKVGFWGVTPVDQAAALTTELTALTWISASASLSLTYQIMVTGTDSFGFSTITEAQTMLMAVQNLQTRQGEVETLMVAAGLIAGGTAAPDSLQADSVAYGNDEGTMLGDATTDLVGFWGAAPVNQPDGLTTTELQVTVTTTDAIVLGGGGTLGIMVTSITGKGFASLAQGHSCLGVIGNMTSRLNEIETRLEELGVIAGGTALTSTTDYDYLDKDSEGGALLGQDTEQKIGFWGTTPVNQPAVLTTAWITLIVSASATSSDNTLTTLITGTSAYRLITSTAAQTFLGAVANLQERTIEMEARLVEVGLIA